jgi:hypothetical protein
VKIDRVADDALIDHPFPVGAGRHNRHDPGFIGQAPLALRGQVEEEQLALRTDVNEAAAVGHPGEQFVEAHPLDQLLRVGAVGGHQPETEP